MTSIPGYGTTGVINNPYYPYYGGVQSYNPYSYSTTGYSYPMGYTGASTTTAPLVSTSPIVTTSTVPVTTVPVTVPTTNSTGETGKQLSQEEFHYYYSLYGNLVYDPNFPKYLSTGAIPSMTNTTGVSTGTSSTNNLSSTGQGINKTENNIEENVNNINSQHMNNFPTVKTVNTAQTTNSNLEKTKETNQIQDNNILQSQQQQQPYNYGAYYGYYQTTPQYTYPSTTILVSVSSTNNIPSYTYYDQLSGQYFSSSTPLNIQPPVQQAQQPQQTTQVQSSNNLSPDSSSNNEEKGNK